MLGIINNNMGIVHQTHRYQKGKTLWNSDEYSKIMKSQSRRDMMVVEKVDKDCIQN